MYLEMVLASILTIFLECQFDGFDTDHIDVNCYFSLVLLTTRIESLGCVPDNVGISREGARETLTERERRERNLMGRATLFLLRKIAANSGRKEKVAGWRMARECGIVFTPSRRKPSPLFLRNCGLDYSFFPLNSLTKSTVTYVDANSQ